MKQFSILPFFFLLVWIQPGHAQVKLADIFSDNMVLQRNEPIKIWGSAPPGAQIEALFSGAQQKTRANAQGGWMIIFQKEKASLQPKNLEVRSVGETLKLRNILIGDVFLLIGQSNMEWPMRGEMHYKEEIKEANNPQLRFYNPKYVGKNIYKQPYDKGQRQHLAQKELFYDGQWQVSDTLSFQAMSAVGYFFGKQLTAVNTIPVGLINLSIGGAPLETFVSLEALQSDKRFSNKTTGNWLHNEHLPDWVRERSAENTSGFSNGNDPSGPNHSYKPGFAFSAGISPILDLSIKGVLWYQGESNAQEIERVEEYPALQKVLVEDLRRRWNKPDLPFYWVQLSSIDTLNYKSHFWPRFRDGQRRALKEIKNGGMAVTSDIGHKDDVHPRNKKAVGARLARWALHDLYHKDIVVSGPLPIKATYQKGKLIIDFKHTASGLRTADGKTLRGFSIDGHDINPVIEGKQVVINLPGKPDFVYYGWEPFSNANLVNSENLPASTFKLKVD